MSKVFTLTPSIENVQKSDFPGSAMAKKLCYFQAMTEANKKSEPKTVAEIYEAALGLSHEEREKLISLLELDMPLRGGGFATPEIEQAWMDEVKRRVALRAQGKSKDIPGEEFLAELRRKYA